MQRFTELAVWQRSHALALDVYRATNDFPKEEAYGLSLQLRRAVVSVVADIAEGSKRRSNKDYSRILNLAEGSLAEVECLLMLGRDLGYLGADAFGCLEDPITEVASMLSGLRKRVEDGAK